MSAFYRLQPKVKFIQKVISGGNNADWIKASFNFAKQMRIMLGELPEEEVMVDHEGK